MAFLRPHFDPDVFVSYSHGVPRSNSAVLKEWTHRLVDELESSILEFEDDDVRNLAIWMDRKIDPTAHLTDELKAKVSASGVLMIVMTKRYLGSTWCKDELDWFNATIAARAGEPGRVFVVQAHETDRSKWPEVLRDSRGHAMVGFSFIDPRTPNFPLGSEDLDKPGAEFKRAVRTLQTALIKRLREMRNRKREAPLAPAPFAGPSGKPRIYLHAPLDAEPAREEVQRELTGEGVEPVSVRATPGARFADAQREAKALREMAKRCQAMVLLRAGGVNFDDDFWEIGVDERERIAVARGAPLPCAVLDKSGEDWPIDAAPWGVARIDASRAAWRSDFRAWLDASRVA